MAGESLSTVPRRLLGVAMLAVVVLLLGLCVAFYNKVFTAQVPVTVQIDQVDNAFQPKADVRFRGVVVGEVDSVKTNGQFATLNLVLNPQQATHIPENATVALLPQSLFGERFVALQSPKNPSSQHIRAGAVITRDRTGSTVQIEQVFNHLLPLLVAVRPADLANTLGAISQGLSGRGAQLGNTITQLHQYLSKLNPALPQLTNDIRELPKLTDTYSEAAPDLIEGLKTLTTTTKTIKDKRQDFEKLYRNGREASDDLRQFLDHHGDDLVDLLSRVKPTLNLLARYSPEYPCLFNRLADAVPFGDAAFGVGTARPALHVTALLANNRGKFLPHQDEPEVTDQRGPMCYNNTPPLEQYPGGPAQDGSTHPPATQTALGALISGTVADLARPSTPLFSTSRRQGR
jgi:phospholipid/cholesterol/gamma-HCH transport system substrate-binding protein